MKPLIITAIIGIVSVGAMGQVKPKKDTMEGYRQHQADIIVHEVLHYPKTYKTRKRYKLAFDNYLKALSKIK